MALTPEQNATLKAAILADQELNAFPNNTDGAFGIAALLNQPASPSFYVWRSTVPISEIMQNGFDWTRVDNLTVGKSRIWEWMMATGVLNPSQSNVRAGVLATFGVAADLATRLAVFGHCQRLATRIEKMLATGTGTTTTEQGVGPATMGFEGAISYQDVDTARNS
jgi:hypothetical protein